ncbi:MAG: hypothetical protein CL927_11585 [Deltaproteobacteria bacterium]|nr:hypothetical protein [Deltaproteobacteria bacterium]HCH62091.1 hypothetical protein [Deltaproteobacteria bacterium]
MLWLALISALAPAEAAIPAAYGVVTHRSTPTVVQGTPPVLTIKAAEANVAMVVQCTAGEQKLSWETGDVPMGEERSFPLAFDDASVRSAECGIFARMANGLAEKKAVTVTWTVTPPEADKPPSEADSSASESSEAESSDTKASKASKAAQ